MTFNMDDYVDVAERIREFAAKYPEGSLQSTLTLMEDGSGWMCTAFAYRTPDDIRPGIGHAFEPVPGKTQFTKDSEAMNAETSAWGRAIVALGFNTKKIASKEEVAARRGNGSSHEGGTAGSGASRPADPHGLQASRADAGISGDGATDKQKAMIRRLEKKLAVEPRTAVDSLSKAQASTLIGELVDTESALAPAAVSEQVDADIPFMWSDGYGRELGVHYDPWRPR